MRTKLNEFNHSTKFISQKSRYEEHFHSKKKRLPTQACFNSFTITNLMNQRGTQAKKRVGQDATNLEGRFHKS